MQLFENLAYCDENSYCYNYIIIIIIIIIIL